MANTNLINAVSFHTTQNSALPALAAAGSNITNALWATAGYTVYGSSQFRSHAGDIDSEDIAVELETTIAEIMAPISLAPEDLILISRRITQITIPFYDISEALMAFDSNFAITSNVLQSGVAQFVSRAVAIEINGFALLWAPTCKVLFENLTGGVAEEGAVKTSATIRPIKNATYVGGFALFYYQ